MPPPRSPSLTHALIVALPTLLFLALLPTALVTRHDRAYFPTVEAGCGAPALTPPPECTQPRVEPCERCSTWSCRVDASWTVTLTASGLSPRCAYRVIAGDKQFGTTLPTAPGAANTIACRQDGDQLRCPLELAPVRPVYLALVGAPRDDAKGDERLLAPGVVLVGRDGALDIRQAALGPTALCVAGAILCAAAFLIIARRRARRPARRLARGALTAWGGAATALIIALMPADVGGFDHVRPERLAWMLPVAALFGFAFGPVIASVRAHYQVRTTAARAFTIFTAIVLTLGASLHLQWSMSEDATLGELVEVKDGFYCALGLAVTLPALTGLGRSPRALFATTVGSALLLAVVAVTSVELAAPRTHVQLTGFYKPPSAFMMIVALLPFVASLVALVALTPERPPWLTRTLVTLGRCLEPADPHERIANARALARALVDHADAIAETRADALAPLGFFTPIVFGSRESWERAGLTRGLDPAGPRLASVYASLIAQREHATIPGREIGECGRVHAVPAPTPSEPAVVILRGGTLDLDPARLRHTRTLVRHVLDTDRRGSLAEAGHLVVDLDPARARCPPGADSTWYTAHDTAVVHALASLRDVR